MSEKVLVAYGSKHGMTAEIAERIGRVIRERGIDVDVAPADKAKDPSGYGAVVLGSGVYAGMWRREAKNYLKAHEAELAKKPLWLFSSGPTGPGELDAMLEGWTFPKMLQPVADRVKPREIKVFHGAFDLGRAGWFEKWIMKRVKAPAGDFRRWPDIEAWASAIAAALKGTRPL